MANNKKLNKGSSGQNRKASEEFLLKYAQKEGVLATGTGLLYRLLESGDGLCPTMADTVVVNQRILNVDGGVIADTYKTGMPEKFSMKEAIPGLCEALLLMPCNTRFECVIPPDLAWGKKGASNKIGPNAVLIFDVRILEVVF